MALLHHPSQRFRFRRRRGFTLVELITAASLMTLMMMGVVQIFAIITETASQAQGSAYAMEQGRALLDSIHRDIRGFDRLGYFRIQRSDTDAAGAPLSLQTPPSIPNQRPALGAPVFASSPITWYSTDCLALTSVGFWEGQMGNSTPRRYTGAEVVYSANVRTPTYRFQVSDTVPIQTVDPRRGLIGRGVWVLTGTDQASGGSDSDDRSKASVMADLVGATAKKRLDHSDSTPAANAVPRLLIKPMTSFSLSQSPWQFRRVAACCASEFLVEPLNTDVTTGAPSWPLPRTEWAAYPVNVVGTTTYSECPRAIRVTVAIHDPSDKKPSTGSSGRYEGYALQEIFWISDP
jgi:hypothetical protein